MFKPNTKQAPELRIAEALEALVATNHAIINHIAQIGANVAAIGNIAGAIQKSQATIANASAKIR